MLYKLFGKNAELLIDHAWGWEPTTIEAIKAYRPSSNLSLIHILNLTQPYVAEKMGVTASTILRYENGSIDNTKKMGPTTIALSRKPCLRTAPSENPVREEAIELSQTGKDEIGRAHV